MPAGRSTVRKPKPKAQPVLFKPEAPAREVVPTAFSELTGTKLWTCHGCHEPMAGARMELIPSSRPGVSHDIYHQGCAGRSN